MLTSIHSLTDSLTQSRSFLNNALTFKNMSIYINKCLIKYQISLIIYDYMQAIILHEIYFI